MLRRKRTTRKLKTDGNMNQSVPDSALITSDLEKNLDYIYESLSKTEDFSKRELIFNHKKCLLVYLSTITNEDTIQNLILKPMIEKSEGIISQTVFVDEVKEINQKDDLPLALLDGNVLLLMEDESIIYSLGAHESKNRSVEEPVNELIIRGSHEGFVEDLRSNLNLIRKRVTNADLQICFRTLGTETHTKMAYLYIKDLANPELVQELERRLSYVDVDFIDSPGQLEEYIEDSPYSPFPQMLNTERPDRVTSQLLDGRIVLLCNGSPSALVFPITFFSFYQSPDDYNSRWHVGSFFRFIRLLSFFVAAGLPALYIAIVSFHYEVIPLDLVFTIKGSLEYVPVPPLVEALMMQIILELLKEAAIRLPGPIAQTLGVVGGLVIGTAIVQANIVSNTMIVVVALTAIASFVVPNTEMATSVRILGFPLMLSAAFLGFIGMTFAFIFLVIHLCKLESFGSPYFSPLAPFRSKDFKDTFIRLPLWKMSTRPSTPGTQRIKRQSNPRGWKNEQGN
ncbi:spore germination protein [Falsibacillus pallidus]|uniref:spore germination protein n=1 Tax=Falsibacillus pallidus TaxID=493781 RepID=UPI003D996B94